MYFQSVDACRSHSQPLERKVSGHVPQCRNPTMRSLRQGKNSRENGHEHVPQSITYKNPPNIEATSKPNIKGFFTEDRALTIT